MELSKATLGQIEADARREWARSPQLRAEFGDRIELFLSYAKARARGLVREVRPGAVVGRSPEMASAAPEVGR